MIKILLSIQGVCAAVVLGFAQTGSDFSKYPEVLHDSLYFELFKIYYQSDQRRAIPYAHKSLQLSKKYDKQKFILKSLNALGVAYEAQNNYDSALYYYHQALESGIKYNQPERLMYTYNNMATIYLNLSVIDLSLEYSFKSLKLSRALKQKAVEISALHNIGFAYGKAKNNEEALAYYTQSLNLMGDEDGNNRYQTKINIAFTYNNMKRYDEAFNIFQEVLNAKSTGRLGIEASYGLATIALQQSKIDKAHKYAQLTLSSSEDQNYPYFTAKAYYILGELSFLEKKYAKAVEYLDKGLEIARDIKSLWVEHDIYLLLSKVYVEQKDFKKSSLASIQAYALKDSIFNERIANNLKNFHLSEQRKELEVIIQEKQHEIDRARIIVILIIIICILLTVATFFVLKSLRLQKNRKKLLEEEVTKRTVDLQKSNEDLTISQHELTIANEKIRNQSEKEKLLLLKELNFLKNQFNSHMTFNFLNYCYSKIHRTSQDTAEAIELFATMLRYSLEISSQEKVLLAREIEYINNFIKLQKLLTDRVCVLFSFEGNINGKVILPRILITFVENAFKHGLINSPEFPISIWLTEDNGGIILKVANKKHQKKLIINTGIGQENVIQILKLYYPDKHKLTVTEDDETYQCELNLRLTI